MKYINLVAVFLIVSLTGCGWLDSRNREVAEGVHNTSSDNVVQPPVRKTTTPIEVKDIRAIVDIDEEWLKSNLTQDMFELDYKLQSSRLVNYNGMTGHLTIRTVSGVTIKTVNPIRLILTADHDMVYRDGKWEVTHTELVALDPLEEG